MGRYRLRLVDVIVVEGAVTGGICSGIWPGLHFQRSETLKMPRNESRGFTLIELLVVVAVIAILIGLLLPALGKARQGGRDIQCLSNVKQMALATAAYAVDFNMTTPAAAYNNASGISPKARGAKPGTPIGSGTYGGMTVWDSIGSLLNPYLDSDPKIVYRCPSAFLSSDDSYQITGEHPYSGTAATDVFKPNYFYMSTGIWINTAPSTFWYPQVWATRNIANIKLGSLPVSESKAVAWVDESTSHHSGSTDIYDRNAARIETRDMSNFGYLDGHAEPQVFRNLRGYLQALGAPIAQSQFGINFKNTPAWRITNDLPSE